MRSLAAAALAAAFSATPAFADDAPIIRSSLRITVHEPSAAGDDDLLSAGLNQAGLVSLAAPGFADPLNPTPLELRRRAIYGNYRGIVDTCVTGVPGCLPGGGMGLLWGPGSPGTPSLSGVPFGLIPGVEYKAYLRLAENSPHVNNIPAAVQIPRHFDPNRPCIVAAMPSGSRSLYGGIAIAEWALFKGCAVALPGKGTDTGFHLLTPDLADNLDGQYSSAEALGNDAQFALRGTRKLDAYITDNPYRVAIKHAHSQINPERKWGEYGLRGIEFALWALNEHFPGRHFSRKNTLVIAAGASNGGGMALRALEDDGNGLIDGVVVTEPNIGPQDGRFRIKFGTDAPFDAEGRSIYDSMTTMSVYAPCAALSPSLAGTPFFGAQPLGAPANALQNRCASLKDKGLVSGDTIAEQSASALSVIRAHGYAAAQDWGIASHEVLNLWRSLQPTYAAAYGRFAIEDNVCGVSFAATDATPGPNFGRPVPLAEAAAKRLFADSSGIPATGGVNLVADRAANAPILENLAISGSTGRQDLNLDAALCFRALQTGERGEDATVEDHLNHLRVRFGTREVATTGKLRGTPTIVIHGRRDALVFPNLHSRAYYGLNQEKEGQRSRLSYIEVTSGQHFDAFISSFFLGATGAQFAPLHYYFVLAMDNMYAHLTSGAPLPPSQVVRPTPRGFTAYTPTNVPALLPAPSLAPLEGDRITFADALVTIPE